MDGHIERSSAYDRTLPPTNVRILHSDAELAAAIARAAESARRLNDRLAARAARDAWMAEHSDQRVGWRQFVRGDTETTPLVAAAPARPSQRVAASPRVAQRGRAISPSPAA
jgi:hypothetical protein